MTTIWAPATAPGRAGVAILRISGPAAVAAALALTGRKLPPPRHAAWRRFYDPLTAQPIDHGVLVVFPGPASFTGEDVVELQHHGGRAVATALARALDGLPGLRPAEPGEFSRRAFLNGKLDLSQAEGLAALVDAQTEAQRRLALRQLEGAAAAAVEGWRELLLGALARVEAEIDFAADEDDVPDGVLGPLRPELAALQGQLAEAAASSIRGERLRRGLTIGIIGPPNAGKSSLLNGLAGREAAIVTAVPGTTRDLLEVPIDLAGVPVVLVDSAGLRETSDPVESLGVARARNLAGHADAVVGVIAAPEVAEVVWDGPLRSATLLVVNKLDLVPGFDPAAIAGAFARGADAVCPVSCLTGEGLADLRRRLERLAQELAIPEGDGVFSHARHRHALIEAADALGRLLAAPAGTELALLAEELRQAGQSLGRITGRWGVEDLLDRIFASFCIGK